MQVYYKDNGEIASKVDIVLAHSLTIKQAHSIAGKKCSPSSTRFVFHYSDDVVSLYAVKTRRAIEKSLPGMGDIDVDLELDETDVKR